MTDGLKRELFTAAIYLCLLALIIGLGFGAVSLFDDYRGQFTDTYQTPYSR